MKSPPSSKKVRTEVNILASSLAKALKSPRRPPPTLTLVDVSSPPNNRSRFNGRHDKHSSYRQHYSRRHKAVTKKKNDGHSRYMSYSAVQYQYQYNHNSNISDDDKEHRRSIIQTHDGRTFIDWLFLRPFRCKQHAIGSMDNNNSIASIFSMPSMPSAAELLCGSIDKAFALERILAAAVGIVNDVSGIVIQKQLLSEVSFQIGSRPIIRYTNGDECILPISSAGVVSEEAFNTVKKICAFTYPRQNAEEQVFTKQQEMKCPISNTWHVVELRTISSNEEEITFKVGRRQADIECETIIQDACHRFLAANVENSTFLFFIVGPPKSGKSSVLREFRKTLSYSNGFHQWNVFDGNEVARLVSTESTHALSSSLISYIEECKSNNSWKQKDSALPYVMVFDDLSNEAGLPMVQNIAKHGINVIATLGNGYDYLFNPNNHFCQFDGFRVRVVTTMILEIKPDGHTRCDSRNINTKYKLTTIGLGG